MKTHSILALVLVLLFTVCAFAETYELGGVAFTIPDTMVEVSDIDEEDDEFVVAFYNDDLDMVIYYCDSDGITPDEYLEQVSEESDIQHGTTQINGIDCVYVVTAETDEDGDYTCVEYAAQDGDGYVVFDFYFEDDSANETILEIMNSLEKA